MVRFLWLSLVVFVVMCGGCNEDFSPPFLVEDFRVLAISADNPEIALTETTELYALVSPIEGVEYTWSACLFNTGPITGFECISPALECCLSQEASATLSLQSLMTNCSADCAEGAATEDEGSDENENVPASFDIDNEMLEEFTKSGGSILIRLKASHGGKAIEAIKTIVVSGEESGPPNQNPSIASLVLTSPSCVEEEGCALEEGNAFAITSGETLEFKASVTEESLETFLDDEVETTEAMTYAWYVTAGEVTSLFSDGAPSDNQYTAPELTENESSVDVTLWLIARDGRGGVDWREYALVVSKPDEPGE